MLRQTAQRRQMGHLVLDLAQADLAGADRVAEAHQVLGHRVPWMVRAKAELLEVVELLDLVVLAAECVEVISTFRPSWSDRRSSH